MKLNRLILATMILPCAIAVPRAQAVVTTAAPPSRPTTDLTSDTDTADPQPLLSTDATWAGVVLIIASGLFIAAACIGPIVRFNLPKDFSAADLPPQNPRPPAK